MRNTDSALIDRTEPAQREQARIALIVKGYPRLSETFVAQEILALEQRGLAFDIWSLRKPTDKHVHAMHGRIAARLFYLPEYLRDDRARVAKGLVSGLLRRGFWRLLGVVLRDLARDPTASRLRRFGQALVLARELDPSIRHLHVHFLHTPASVARYAAILTGRRFSFSAHAKDIWTIPEWEKREKIAGADWGVTCTRDGLAALREAAREVDTNRVLLVHHGLDLARFPPPPAMRPPRDGRSADDPVRIVTVGRAVEKKGFDDLLAALALLPRDLAWRLVHIGGGPLLDDLKAQAARLGLSARIEWRGARPQEDIVAALRDADLFALPSRPAADGDRDGLPNVIMEAASQALPIVASDFAGVPEFVQHGQSGWLVPPADPARLAAAIETLARDPAERVRLGDGARHRLREHFSADSGVNRIERLLRLSHES